MLYFYEYKNKILVSDTLYPEFPAVSPDCAEGKSDIIYLLTSIAPGKSRRYFSIFHPSHAFSKSEGLELLRIKETYGLELPDWIISRINSGKAVSLNISYPSWENVLNHHKPERWNINVVGLGDVGGMLVTGLRLLGGSDISKIGIYDRDQNKIKRWVYEAGQIYAPFKEGTFGEDYPDVVELSEENLFDCDMFVFCVSSGVPDVGSEIKDVRMAQFEGNSRIIKEYALRARKEHFNGIFSVVSDPVDLLCKVVFLESNRGGGDSLDFMGLYPEQIRGYGLGVMNARAAFYAKMRPETSHYLTQGRAYGPHGQGLVIADSVTNYSDEISIFLTEKAQNANLDIRSAGFKPYIAPALSSGALSLLATIRGQWHYSATFIGGVYMGAKNRMTNTGTVVEALNMPDNLWKRLNDTYESLGRII